MSGLPESFRSLLEPGAYPHPVSRIRLIETPISWVLLTGDYAYKIKRPVLLPFVDLRSAAHRRFLCREELRLNRRFAPELYLELCSLTRTASGVRVGGDGEVVETAVRMRQFDTGQSLDALLAAREVGATELACFGAAIAACHASLPVAHEPGAPGDPARLHAGVRRNWREAAHALAAVGLSGDIDDLRQSLDSLQDELQPLLVERWHRGKVRECHGDLHARNVVRTRTGLVAFDSLEFEPWFRWIDVGAETAFLAMDLEARESRPLALAFLSGYLDVSGDYEQLRALPLHVADRALVRAKVAALEANASVVPGARESALNTARGYIEVAKRHATARRRDGRIILMHGLSGSGKSWVAAQVAARLPALHLRSDVVRKQVVSPGQAAYTPAATMRTYECLAAAAADALVGGLDVVVDATFLRRANRADFRRMAAIHGARLCVVECLAPEAVLRQRIDSRAALGQDPSEATTAVLDLQLERLEPIVPTEGLPTLRVDTTRSDGADGLLAQLASPAIDESQHVGLGRGALRGNT